MSLAASGSVRDSLFVMCHHGSDVSFGLAYNVLAGWFIAHQD